MSMAEIGNLTLYQVRMLLASDEDLNPRITGESIGEITAQQQSRWEQSEKKAENFVDNEMMRWL